MYVEPGPVRFPELVRSGFTVHAVRRRLNRSAELFLPVDGDAARVYRRATRNGFVARRRTAGMITAEHVRLIETFYRGQELSPYLAELALSLPVIMTSPYITIVEAWEDGSMRGFVAVHDPFEEVSIGLFLTHGGQTRGVSDFLYAQMIDHAAGVGSRLVNVGASATPGQYAFKRKWRCVPLVPPYYSVVLRRRGRPAAAKSTWLLRILGRVA